MVIYLEFLDILEALLGIYVPPPRLGAPYQMDLLLESCEFIPEEGFAASLVGGGSLAASSTNQDEDDIGEGSSATS